MKNRVYFKEVRRDNHRSWFDNHTEWIPGKTTEDPDVDRRKHRPKTDFQYAPGLYCTYNSIWAKFGLNYPSAFYLVEPIEIIEEFEKEKMVRCASIKTLRYLGREELNRRVGYNLWDYHNSLVCPLSLTPDPNIPVPELAHHANYLYHRGLLNIETVYNFVQNNENKSFDLFELYTCAYFTLLEDVLYDEGGVKYKKYINLDSDENMAICAIKAMNYFPKLRWKFTKMCTDGVDLVSSIGKLWDGGYYPCIKANSLNIYTGKKLNVAYFTKKWSSC